MAAPHIQLTSGGVLVLGAVAAGGLALWWASRQLPDAIEAGTEAAKDAAWAVTPWNNDNVFSEGVDSIGRNLTGDANWTLGGWIHDVLHGTQEEIAERARQQATIDRANQTAAQQPATWGREARTPSYQSRDDVAGNLETNWWGIAP